MKYSHWFWYSEKEGDNRIYTQGLGNHPAGNHWYETPEELHDAIKVFEDDGYQNLGKC